MTWGEAYRLTTILAGDPSSAIAAAINEWEHPITHEAITLAALFDSSEAGRIGRKAKPYPRPWIKTRRTFGRARLSKDELRAILDNAPTGGDPA